MNVSKYIKREKNPPPRIHEDAYIEEFQHPKHFSLKGGEELDAIKSIKGGRTYEFRPAHIPFADFGVGATAHIMSGEHPWAVYGDFGKPLDLPIEAPELFNPKGLNDAQIHTARWQAQQGVQNDFSQRQMNIQTGVPLTDIKNMNTEMEASLEAVKKGIAEHFDNPPVKTPLIEKVEKHAVKKQKEALVEKIKSKMPVRVEPINYDRAPKPKAPEKRTVSTDEVEQQMASGGGDEQHEQFIKKVSKFDDTVEDVLTPYVEEGMNKIPKEGMTQIRQIFKEYGVPLPSGISTVGGIKRTVQRYRSLMLSETTPKKTSQKSASISPAVAKTIRLKK